MDWMEKMTELSRYLTLMEDCLGRQAEKAETGRQCWERKQYFPNLLRSSVFIMIYAEIETRLDQLCLECQRVRGIGLKPDQLRGNGVQRAHEYLGQVCGLELNKARPQWDWLRDCNHLRNLLVHNRGVADNRDREIRRFAEQCPDLELDRSGRLVLGPGFCPRMLEAARQLSAALEREIHS